MSEARKRIEVLVRTKEGERRLSLPGGTVLLEALRGELGERFSGSGFCGRGSCGRCLVRFLTGAPAPSPADRAALAPERLREGYRLACTARPKEDCVVEEAFSAEKGRSIVTSCDLAAEKAAEIGKSGTDTVIAVDLGTTTVAAQLLEAGSGRVADSWTCLNPQRIYGADVISRIQAASREGRGAEEGRLIRRAVAEGIRFLKDSALEKGLGEPGLSVIAGNTAMEHLFMGYDVSGLGESPFKPCTLGEISVEEGEFADFPELPLVLFPSVSAFVGGDVVAGLYACGLHKTAEGGVRLLVDLGTNGEMALTAGEKILCAAAAAGPAFEGGPGVNAPGSDVVAAAARLLRDGVMDRTGLLREPWFSEGVEVGGLRLTQGDIRSLQTAKAAVRCGLEVLLEKAGLGGWDCVERVELAGGFGYFLDAQAAVRIGLLPREVEGRVTAVGNTSLAGAGLYARQLSGALLTAAPGWTPGEIARRAQAFNLAAEDGFGERFIGYMNF